MKGEKIKKKFYFVVREEIDHCFIYYLSLSLSFTLRFKLSNLPLSGDSL